MKIIIFLFFPWLSLNIYAQSTDSIGSKYNDACVYLWHGNIIGAKNIAISLIKKDSLNGKYFYLMGDVKRAEKLFEEAKYYYNLGFSLEKKPLKYFNMLKLVNALDNKDDSSFYYLNKIIEIKPDSAYLYEERAMYYLNIKDINKVKENLHKSIDLGGKNAVILLKILTDNEKKYIMK